MRWRFLERSEYSSAANRENVERASRAVDWEQAFLQAIQVENTSLERSGRRRIGVGLVSLSSPVYYSKLLAYADDINLITAVDSRRLLPDVRPVDSRAAEGHPSHVGEVLYTIPGRPGG